MALVQRVQNICLKPKQEWEVIAGETSSTADLLKNYALPLAAIGVMAGFIGMSFIGTVPPMRALVGAAVGLALQLASVFVLGMIIDALAPRFGGEKNSARALKVAVYSLTPGWVAAVVQIFPSLVILAGFALLYGIYILYLGLERLMKSPQEKAVSYTLVVVACAIGILLVDRLISGTIMGAGTTTTVAFAAGLR